MLKNIATLLLAFYLIIALGLDKAQAHPHAWYTLKVKVVNQPPQELKLKAKEYGQAPTYQPPQLKAGESAIYGLLFTMYLDKISSAPVIIDLKRGQEKIIWQELATNIVSAKFFSNLTVYQQKSNLKVANLQFASAIAIVKVAIENNALVLQYYAPLSQPYILKSKEYVSLQTYDSTYWIDMLYPNKEAISFSKNNPAYPCQVIIKDSQPHPQLRAYAKSLKADENPKDPDFGRNFAQRIYFACPFAP